MNTPKTVLYWSKITDWNPEADLSSFCNGDCSAFVPVFCFDQREERYFASADEYRHYFRNRILEIERLRAKLHKLNSNLLVVSGNYEVLIPSIARVLNASLVVQNDNLLEREAKLDDLAVFRKQKTEEVEHFLKMHSISMITIGSGNNNRSGSQRLVIPPFPEINPGNLPDFTMHS